MNLLADALVPYLLSNGIQYKRNRPEMTAGSSIREANAGNYDLYLALHSNGAPEGHYGEERGIIAFYYPVIFPYIQPNYLSSPPSSFLPPIPSESILFLSLIRK